MKKKEFYDFEDYPCNNCSVEHCDDGCCELCQYFGGSDCGYCDTVYGISNYSGKKSYHR